MTLKIDFFKLITLIIFFFPQFQSFIGLAFEQILTVGITVTLFVWLCIKGSKSPFLCYFVALIFLVIFSIDLLRSLNFVIINDFFEYIKPFSFSIYFIFGFSQDWTEEQAFENFYWLMKVFLFVSILGVLEARVNLFDNLFVIFYKANRSVLRHKAVFSYISPYSFASILILPIFFFYLSFFGKKEKRYLIAFLICVLCMLLTQSKTVFLGFIFTFLILLFFIFCNKWIIGRKSIILFSNIVIVFIIILIPSIIILAQTKFSYLYGGLSVFFKAIKTMHIQHIIESTPSIGLRYKQLIFALESQDWIPLIGVAIGKKVLMPESFYALYIYRSGLLGICIHFCMIFFAAKRAFFLSKKYALIQIYHIKSLSIIFLSFFVFFISLFFSYFSSAVTDQTRLAYVFYFILGYIYSIPKFNFY